MEEQQNIPVNPFRHAMKYGLPFGGAIWLLFVCMTIPSAWTTIAIPLFMIGILVMLSRFARHYRDTECKGKITYMQALSYILILFFFASLVAGVLRYFYLAFINTTYLTDSLNQALLLFEQMQMDMPDDLIGEMKELMTPIHFTVQFIMFDCMVGLFLGLLYAFFIRKDNEIIDNE